MILLVQGNTLQIPLADKSVQCIVTSPPYWGLRSYAGTAKWEGGDSECDHKRGDYSAGAKRVDGGVPRTNNHAEEPWRDGVCRKCGARRHDAQLGSEPLHDCLGWATGNDCGSCYICKMRQVARECWRVLRDDGVMFWNIADSYAANRPGGQPPPTNTGNRAGYLASDKQGAIMVPPGLKPKDKCGIPERTALAFQADGWWWRSDIIWHKPNPMPESVTDRPTKSHEFVYVFTKAERYYWDSEAVREDSTDPDGSAKRYEAPFFVGAKHESGGYSPDGQRHTAGMKLFTGGRNLRDVWTMATQAYHGPHFATFPAELPRRCIKAATSERGACPKCGKGWERIIIRDYIGGRIDPNEDNYQIPNRGYEVNTLHGFSGSKKNRARIDNTTLGWRPACACDGVEIIEDQPRREQDETKEAHQKRIAAWYARWDVLKPIYDALITRPCVTLDPFNGAVTTGLVARELGRHYIGLELSGEYLQQSRERLSLNALDAWKGNGKAHETDLSDLPMFKGANL